jgi:hypothetical protein
MADTYWHGGRYPASGTLEPQTEMRSGRPGDGYVYVTTNRDLAATYAATLPGSWLMQVQPVGDVEPDPESILDYSFRCRTARVVRRYTISRAERISRSSAVGIANPAETETER